jgi:hypothetical protein
VLDLNSTQIAEQVDDSFSLTTDIENTISPVRNDTINLRSPSSDQSILKCNTSVAMASSVKKQNPVKKKRPTDTK